MYIVFEKGLHVVHRTDSPWSGLGCDLAIEQDLMRYLKTTGSLTRGSALMEVRRALWIPLMPTYSEYNTSTQRLTSISYSPTEQHKEMHMSRLSQDRRDGAKILEFLRQF